MNTPDEYHGFVYKTIFPNGNLGRRRSEESIQRMRDS